jgi:hypothetical protein
VTHKTFHLQLDNSSPYIKPNDIEKLQRSPLRHGPAPIKMLSPVNSNHDIGLVSGLAGLPKYGTLAGESIIYIMKCSA